MTDSQLNDDFTECTDTEYVDLLTERAHRRDECNRVELLGRNR
jgi:hypothetical protein